MGVPRLSSYMLRYFLSELSSWLVDASKSQICCKINCVHTFSAVVSLPNSPSPGYLPWTFAMSIVTVHCWNSMYNVTDWFPINTDRPTFPIPKRQMGLSRQRTTAVREISRLNGRCCREFVLFFSRGSISSPDRRWRYRRMACTFIAHVIPLHKCTFSMSMLSRKIFTYVIKSFRACTLSGDFASCQHKRPTGELEELYLH